MHLLKFGGVGIILTCELGYVVRGRSPQQLNSSIFWKSCNPVTTMNQVLLVP
jgi:hypothetical protein